MTDFLMRLAERSLGIGELVRPRPASLFEPRGAVDEPPLVDGLEVVEERVAAAPPRTPARLRAAAPPPAEEPRAAADRLPAPPPGVDDAPPPEPVEPSEVSEPGSARPAALASVPAPLPEPQPRPVVPGQVAGAADDDARAPVPAPTTVVVHATRLGLGEPEEAHPEEPQRRAEATRLPPPAVPARPPDAGEPEPAAAPPAGQGPGWLPAPPAPAQPRVLAAQHDAEPPVVNVTIGRVDVRAVLPAAPPERAARGRRPRMTLDEYLREGGRP